jgi:hypothetical protein
MVLVWPANALPTTLRTHPSPRRDMAPDPIEVEDTP